MLRAHDDDTSITAMPAGKVNQMQTLYFAIVLVYAILMIASVVCGVWLVVTSDISPFVGISFACCTFSYLLAAGMHGSFWTSVKYFPQFIMLLPMFVNLMPIYSTANAHDISWVSVRGRRLPGSSRLALATWEPSHTRLIGITAATATASAGHQGGQPAERDQAHARGPR